MNQTEARTHAPGSHEAGEEEGEESKEQPADLIEEAERPAGVDDGLQRVGPHHSVEGGEEESPGVPEPRKTRRFRAPFSPVKGGSIGGEAAR